ncbi:unnamed protein product [Peronospora farinosa]|uniref:Uncharacterized protein n=1 Tax=Peronospora farinosa TaxID=134698 RepID=A0AAV0SSU1_9STRA|nr:unnamed protein product [Peronospora farinosa]CAI5706268.1 unnamed protein product [Peronospora farinosa]
MTSAAAQTQISCHDVLPSVVIPAAACSTDWNSISGRVPTSIWRLVEELDRGEKETQSRDGRDVASLLRVVSDRMLLCCKNVKDDQKSVASHLDDQLLEMEALGLTECGAQIGAVPQRVVVFTTAGRMLVKDLAVDIVSIVIKQINDLNTSSGKVQHPLLAFLVGFCAHIDLVRLTSMLEVLKMLVALYKTAAHNTVSSEHQRLRQSKQVYYIVCVALLQSGSVDSLCQQVSFDAAAIIELLKQFPMQLCSELAYEDFRVATPVH